MLSAFLDRYRETILWKLEGLTKEQASARQVPSATTLLGIVKHLAYVERGWFPIYFAGGPVNYPWAEDEPDPDIDFRVAFFFQAEDGIRDLTVTGVQTCALPI